MPNFYEFFAGGGMARAGLGAGWTCLFANDFDHKKGLAYQANWGTGGELLVGDVRKVTASELSGYADLVWGSFPCQDLSLAGGGAGLKGERSGTFYPFWDVITGLIDDNRAPKLVAIENVCGTLTSHGGKDFEAICRTFADAGYRYGPLIINASLFRPQSRPRLVRDRHPAGPGNRSLTSFARAGRAVPHSRLTQSGRGSSCADTGTKCFGGICRRRHVAKSHSPKSSKKTQPVSTGTARLRPGRYWRRCPR